ncbi:hypothetical protein [Sphingomonas sp. 3P27F8]|uniref:hypothetical protein n=1 Tax=Sphingomonas sp. 3P27F8 TaxID=2502213 RepID=UPI0010F904CA|nr:hypothetical protein [Sphingomonas sp. 3P27F8]
MRRPPSILRYEQLYLASFVLGLAASAVNWKGRTAQLSASPALANLQWLAPASLAVGIVISLTLWYFTARSPSLAAKWVVVVFAALSVLGIAGNVFTLLKGGPLFAVLLGIVVSALYIAAAALLFRPDARLWFGETINGNDAA